MANLQDFYTSGVGGGGSSGVNAANAAAPNSPAKATGSGADLAKNIVMAWAVTFVALGAMNIVIKRYGREL